MPTVPSKFGMCFYHEEEMFAVAESDARRHSLAVRGHSSPPLTDTRPLLTSEAQRRLAAEERRRENEEWIVVSEVESEIGPGRASSSGSPRKSIIPLKSVTEGAFSASLSVER